MVSVMNSNSFMAVLRRWKFLCRLTIAAISCTVVCSMTHAEGQLLGTAGVGPLEGGSGGGISPWATLAGYATRDEWAATATISKVDVSDFTLNAASVALNYQNRIELSIGRLDIQDKSGGEIIRQNIGGLKVRVLGDLVYDKLPLLSVGLQHKSLIDQDTARAVGAQDTSGTDFYISAARAWLNGPGNRTIFLNVNLRNTEANQLGLLGFGGDRGDRHWLVEGAAAIYFNRHWAIGAEYRQKPDNLSALKEDDWNEVFIAYFPSKSLSFTGAYLELGSIAGQRNQNAWYVSMQAAF